jgi:dephospho-CoA kinase
MITRIGITGGIGSGKSEVCEAFVALGIFTLSADTIARQLTDSDPAVKKKITARFGTRAYDSDAGMLNRQYIAEIVFRNKEKLALLNSIVHPAVFKALDGAIRPLDEKGKNGYLIIEAALLFESRLDKKVDYVLTVVADEARRIDRVRKRDNISEEQIRQRISNQFPVDEAIDASDFVLYNNETVDVLHAKVNFFHTIFSALKPRSKQFHGSSR